MSVAILLQVVAAAEAAKGGYPERTRKREAAAPGAEPEKEKKKRRRHKPKMPKARARPHLILIHYSPCAVPAFIARLTFSDTLDLTFLVLFPQGFDPANPGPPPDPERWLPVRERSSWKSKRKLKSAPMKGAQGSSAAAAAAAAVVAPAPAKAEAAGGGSNKKKGKGKK